MAPRVCLSSQSCGDYGENSHVFTYEGIRSDDRIVGRRGPRFRRAGSRANRRETGRGPFRDLVYSRSPDAFRPGHALSALVLVPRVEEGVEDALKADPACSIAYWGIAQSLLANPFNPTPAKNLSEGLAAVQKGQQAAAKTQRENDLIAAVGTYYTDFDKLDQRIRAQAYLKAMEEVAGRYPDDDEVQLYYALALDIAASPSDKSYANQLKAAAILEPIAKRRPQHPGVAHYLIHTYDYPALAQKGLDAALRYAKIAEAAPHAQHMPSHIFTRIGYWKESAASNKAAHDLAKADKEPDDQLHASDYMVYADLQMGR
jgi:hypothetical protein